MTAPRLSEARVIDGRGALVQGPLREPSGDLAHVELRRELRRQRPPGGVIVARGGLLGAAPALGRGVRDVPIQVPRALAVPIFLVGRDKIVVHGAA
eukprot:CAMPEP_0176195198 /NCGR_PEP_ID=MMETSP0121_2-20121125/6390_1 /TAXON_ID=160619 /ORGANISM="Kryptoperidinium foliaceum, Strain CCMP 1326" /LENGTH=95 /DNA_ID=CAMNT_0017533963 /DNA_START=94 /DNA_END=379 /DNA_ORIENTATION=+